MTFKIISQSISTEVWNRAGIELLNPGSAVGHATDCTMRAWCQQQGAAIKLCMYIVYETTKFYDVVNN